MAGRGRVPRWVGTVAIAIGLLFNGVIGVLMLLDGDLRGLGQLAIAYLLVWLGLRVRRDAEVRRSPSRA